MVLFKYIFIILMLILSAIIAMMLFVPFDMVIRNDDLFNKQVNYINESMNMNNSQKLQLATTLCSKYQNEFDKSFIARHFEIFDKNRCFLSFVGSWGVDNAQKEYISRLSQNMTGSEKLDLINQACEKYFPKESDWAGANYMCTSRLVDSIKT